MKETIEFRVPLENAVKYLPHDLGIDLGWVRKIELSADDPLVAVIGKLQQQFNAQGAAFFHGWTIHRRYSQSELDGAALMYARPKRTFEPAGEECGTIYDEALACDYVFTPEMEGIVSGNLASIPTSTCGFGARQVSALFLDGRRIPRSVDFAQTIAEEIVVSSRAIQAFRERGLTGAEFDVVRLSNRHGEVSGDHHQMKIVGSPVELASATRAGGGPFDEGGYGRCPRSHLIGLNLLSEVSVKAETVAHVDVMATRQVVGVRRGLLRPRPLLLLSPRAWRAIRDQKLKGLAVEVANVV